MLKFNLVVEIDEESFAEVLEINPDVTIEQLKSELNNACYLGLGCIESIILRQTGVETIDTYVEKLS